jgi:hypothetical protein
VPAPQGRQSLKSNAPSSAEQVRKVSLTYFANFLLSFVV